MNKHAKGRGIAIAAAVAVLAALSIAFFVVTVQGDGVDAAVGDTFYENEFTFKVINENPGRSHWYPTADRGPP